MNKIYYIKLWPTEKKAFKKHFQIFPHILLQGRANKQKNQQTNKSIEQKKNKNGNKYVNRKEGKKINGCSIYIA